MIYGSEKSHNHAPLSFVEKIALATSTNIEVAELNGRLDGDASLCFILEAMQRNNNSKVRTLNLQNCQLTNASAQKLIEFVINNKKIIEVNIQGNNISIDCVSMLHNAIDLNRLLRRPQYKPTFIPLKETSKPTFDPIISYFIPGAPLIKRRT